MKYTKHQPPIEKSCVICGKQFKVKACRARLKPHLCCSLECALVQRRKEHTKVECAFCKAPGEVSPWQLRKMKLGWFCSHSCYGKWRSENLAGENSPVWKGGKGKDYGLRFWKQQRALARVRDKDICRGCGLPSATPTKKLEVHHIKPYDTFDDPKEANDLENLVTLCPKCHHGAHRTLRSGKGAFSWEDITPKV